MRVPNLEELVTQGEQEALPESRLKALIEAPSNPYMGDERLLVLCREALGSENEQKATTDYRGISYARHGTPTDAGYKLYHRILSVLAGLYPGIGTWHKSTVLEALNRVVEAGL